MGDEEGSGGKACKTVDPGELLEAAALGEMPGEVVAVNACLMAGAPAGDSTGVADAGTRTNPSSDRVLSCVRGGEGTELLEAEAVALGGRVVVEVVTGADEVGKGESNGGPGDNVGEG